MNRLQVGFFVLCLFGGGEVNAVEVAKPVDASGFDVAGVKLGVTPNEAVTAAAARLGIDKRAIQFDKFPTLNSITGTKEPLYFIAKSGLATLSVHFVPRVPVDKARPMAVSLIIYEIPWTPDNVKSMKATALQKYGQTSNGIVGVTYQWCARPNKNIGMGCSEFQGAMLSLSGTRLELSDPSLKLAVIDFMRKRQNAAPGF